MSNYETLMRDNLTQAFARGADSLVERLPAEPAPDGVAFSAFGARCRITPEQVLLDEEPQTGPRGVVIALYAARAAPDPMILEPMAAFRDLPDSMPYQGAFVAHAERPLVPHVPALEAKVPEIRERLGLEAAAPDLPGDFRLVLRPLPKIALGYVFYRPDEEFPASATCLLSRNAPRFLALDGLADTAEYTTRTLLRIIEVAP